MPAESAEAPVSELRASARRVGALVRHDFLQLRRDPGPVISRLLMPMVLLVVFEPLYRATARVGPGGSAIVEAAPRVLVMFSMFAISTVGAALLTERTWRTWSWLRTTPASTGELLIGKIVPLLGVLLLQQALVLGMARLAFGLEFSGGALVLAVASLSWALCILACGTLVATFARSNNQLSSITDVSGLLLSSLGGAVVPVALMPDWLRAISPISPAHWGVRAFQGALLGQPGQALGAAAVLAGLAVVIGSVAGWRINRRWGRPELL
ncbi:ABC transporter permease [Amycolatopsis samaneae]|uniref:Transport permease protein n=1 Tax=Amycolatopsis samaneae TaxID=664691 RepID=A0ABW5GW92_9PSEU